MSTNLYKYSAAAARHLRGELREVLGGLDPAVAQPLLDRLDDAPHSTPSLVLTGQYSSGKSTLVKALMGGSASVAIGSGVTTDDVREYDWDGDVRLVDTPGVHAGRPHHDDLAEEALQSADLVLFAVTVELFDDVLTAHLRDVLGRLGKSRQTLVVLTKAGTMEATAGVRGEAIKAATGSFSEVPWVECDAQYYLDGLGLARSDPEASRAFIDASKIGDVTAVINRFAQRQGELGKLSQPLQLIVALVLEASAALSDDPAEQAALNVLARQRSALSRKRLHLDDLLQARATQFRAGAVRAATRFAGRVEQDELDGTEDAPDVALEEHLAVLNDDLQAAMSRFEEEVRQVLELQLDDLASEVLEIEASPYGRVALELGEPRADDFGAPTVEVRPGGASAQTPPRWAGDLARYLGRFREVWGAGGGTKASAGSTGHQVVLKVGRTFGKKFKPWEAARTANRVGQAARVGGIVINIGLELYGVVAEERAAVKAEQARADRRRDITHEVLSQTDDMVDDTLREISATLEETFKPEMGRIDAMAEQIHGARDSRSKLRDRLEAVRVGAEAALSALAGSSELVEAGNTAATATPSKS